MTFPDILALLNDVLQAVIVIFGTAVVLYNAGRSIREPIIRAFSILVALVSLVYLTELLVSRTIVSDSTDVWLRVEWIGIALVPAAQYQLSNALLSTTGAPPYRRKYFMATFYVLGLVILGLVLGTDWIVADLVLLERAPHLRAGTFFALFVAYFVGVTAVSIINLYRARLRGITSSTRQRMTAALLTSWAAPVAVFPYLAINSNPERVVPIWLWLVLILGNLTVGLMFALLTSHLVYFGAGSPDRVVRARLYKFMARVPLAGTIVLLVFVAVSRSSPILGLPTETALGFALVATVMLVEWAIHVYKRPLERFFQLNDNPDIRRIQQLSDRLLTTRDLHQFLESVLAATCEALRTPTAFVAALTPDGPKLEAVVGPLLEPDAIWQEANWRDLTQANGTDSDLQTIGDFIVWQDYWIRPLYNRHQTVMLGILGIRARSETPNFNERERVVLDKLLEQAKLALEDRVLQQEVFAAVEKLLPEITALQEQRSAASFGSLPALTNPSDDETLVDDPEFSQMVRDALTHYWGGPKLTNSPLMRLAVVQKTLAEHDGNAVATLRSVLAQAIALQKPEGERNLTTAEWILYNILEMKFVQGKKVRDVARRLAMSESDLYRKQRVAIENVARTIATMEESVSGDEESVVGDQ
jgi:hypothetical protein